jgi:hypothetical protein
MDADATNKFACSTGHFVEIEKTILDATETEHSLEADRQFVVHIDCAFGQCLPLDVDWIPSSELCTVEGNQIFFEGIVNSIENENDDDDDSDSKDVHKHYRLDNDSKTYWDQILRYLLDFHLLKDRDEANA